MGHGGSKTPLVVLQTEEQLHFRSLSVQKEVAEAFRRWQEEGAPLGLTLELFALIVGLAGREAFVDRLFRIFDTDRNQKVDAFELLSVIAILASGGLDRKIEVLFPVFDFSCAERLSFDEVNILLASVTRGLAKVCDLTAEDEDNLVQACRQCFDCHNLPYNKSVTKEQLRRWLQHDVEIVRYLDAFQRVRSLDELDTALRQREDVQATVFQHCSEGTAEVDLGDLLRSADFRSSLGNPSEEAGQGLLQAMAGDDSVSIDVARFAEGTRAWNAFCILDGAGTATLQTECFPLLRWLSQPERQGLPEAIPKGELTGAIVKSGLPKGPSIARDDWLVARLRHVGSTSSAPDPA